MNMQMSLDFLSFFLRLPVFFSSLFVLPFNNNNIINNNNNNSNKEIRKSHKYILKKRCIRIRQRVLPKLGNQKRPAKAANQIIKNKNNNNNIARIGSVEKKKKNQT